MAKRTNRVAWGSAALLAMVLTYAGGLFLFGQRISKREAHQIIRTHLPLGSDEMEVLRFLDARDWQHGGPLPTYAYQRSFDPQQIEFGAAAVIHARIDNVGLGWASALGCLQIDFGFDNRGKLTRYLVEQIGPELP
jgi:hypothetical protein